MDEVLLLEGWAWIKGTADIAGLTQAGWEPFAVGDEVSDDLVELLNDCGIKQYPEISI